MIKFFRHIRQQLFTDNRFSTYPLYAIGEIALVVIGILIALHINNLNEAKKISAKEVAYLKNINNDLKITGLDIDEFITSRTQRAVAARNIVEHYNGKPVTNWNEFNKYTINVCTWQRFYQTDNTFKELMNSGNLAIITNDTIKNELLALDKLYKKLKYTEDHFRFDAEITLYEPSYGMTDIHSLSNNYSNQRSNGKEDFLGNLSDNDFRETIF
ncbi:DUF6090 family protein [Winogradskyella ursingii]|uniref:DUF6090 family protein n=1 Tax=Winogradskyella ursingii TaxID=2686079 RepID=UPI0015C9E566|nr:DUF6090 family protein [Winogradskyella ursingii]